MAAKRRRRFGWVRRLPSGRYQASFVGPNNRRQVAPTTFRTETDADRWLVKVEADVSSGAWLDEKLVRQPFREYAEAYLIENPDVARWAETCRRNMRLHMVSLLDMPLVAITGPVVRSWHSAGLKGPGGADIDRPVLLVPARGDEVRGRRQRDPVQPCKIRGAGSERAKERPVASIEEVGQLIEAITPRYRAAVLLAAWCSLRRGEICGLAVVDLDLAAGEVWVRRNRVELLESPDKFDAEPKTDAGKRSVPIPPHLRPYLAEWAGDEWLFIGCDGERMRGNAIYQALVRARRRGGVKVSFHDLRHTGQTLAAATGATLADLKKRAGHSSNAAAARYLHAVEGRDRELADQLSQLAAQGTAVRLPKSIIVKH